MYDTALELYNSLLETYDPANLALNDYDCSEWFKKENQVVQQ